MTDVEKQKFRRTSTWSNFRQKIRRKYNKKDYLTGKDLTRTWNLHHLDMDDRHYTDLSEDGKFVPLNKDTHKFVHWLFRIYRHDKDVLRRLKIIMDLMYMYNPPRRRHELREDD